MNEAERILEENRRRDREVDGAVYAAWQPAELFMRHGRERAATILLKDLEVFPAKGDRCLEVGFGSRGWLPTLLDWGLDCADLYGIELDPNRVEVARQAIPGSHLQVGDARSLPWEEGFFRLVVVSTVLSSILEPAARLDVAQEVTKVVEPGGAVLVYDFCMNNPANPHVRKLSRSDIVSLFPDFRRQVRAITLAPPIARRVVPVSWTLASLLETMPFLKSHLVAVMVKPGVATQG